MISLKRIGATELAIYENIDVPTFPVIAYAAIEDDHVLATYGLAWSFGACWLWFSFIDRSRAHSVYVVREAKRMLKKAVQLGEKAVFVMRDDEPTSERLLKCLGFDFVKKDDLGLGLEEIWQWPHSPQWLPSSPSAQPLSLPAPASTQRPRKTKTRKSKLPKWKASDATNSPPRSVKRSKPASKASSSSPASKR
jgi:hypothetical protein